MITLYEYMKEKKLISRGHVFITALVGAFAGATLMFMVALIGLLG